MKSRRQFFVPLVLLLAGSLLGLPSVHAAGSKRFERSVESYTVPDLVLINQDRQQVRLRELLAVDRPVMLDFIYGTCTTICPVLSAGFSNLQKRLGEHAADVQLVSITIDPEHDTPEVMHDYLQRYRRKPGWDFLTGSKADIDKAMHAFNAFVPNKMNHYPLTFLRAPDGKHWIRIYGLISTADLMAEYQKLRAE